MSARFSIFKKRFNLDFLEKILYVCGAFVLAFFHNANVLYGAFLSTFFLETRKFFQTNNFFCILKILLASIIIPNNYIIIFITTLFYLFSLKNKKTVNFNLCIIVLLLICNAVLNWSPLVNVSFSIIYLLPIIMLFSLFEKEKNQLKENFHSLTFLLKNILFLEILSVIFSFIANYNILKLGGNANDWITGTFGYHQGNIFLYFMLFSCLIFKKDYDESKMKSNIVYIFLSLVLAISTNSIALILFFIASYFLVTIFKSSFREKLRDAVLLVVVIILFFLFTPNWIKGYLVKLTNYEYLIKTVAKLEVYEDTYVNIPQNDYKFFLIGNGIGRYSSRAALTCTGKYVNFYNKFFEPSISEYTNDYILNRYIKYNLQQGQGTLYSPFSTIISLQGEFGIIGLLLFLIIIWKLFRNSKMNSKIFILFFLFSCFIENYLEFEKVMLLVFLLYFLETEIEKKGLIFHR